MKHEQGFTLVELAIVILIMGLVLGGLAMPLSVQRENARLREGRDQLSDIEESIMGFALANGYLPCPATPGSAGIASFAGGSCTVQHGFVPASTLGLAGSRNVDNLLLDPWASPIRYSVSAADADGDGNWDFTNAGEMQQVTMPSLLPDIAVCRAAAGSSATACVDQNTTLTDQAPLVIYSLGKDWATSSSPDQIENVGTTLGGGPSGTRYAVANDIVFVSRQHSVQGGSEFDDLLVWTAAPMLYSRLLAVGQLP
jgi:prepilin-type N-terminal cleavage/methylation domain-containing protein